MQQNLDRTQLVPDDGADIPQEMGWDDEKQVCIQPIALVISFCCLVQLPALPIFGHVLALSFIIQFFQQIGNHSLAFQWSVRSQQLPSSKCLYGVQCAGCCTMMTL